MPNKFPENWFGKENRLVFETPAEAPQTAKGPEAPAETPPPAPADGKKAAAEAKRREQAAEKRTEADTEQAKTGLEAEAKIRFTNLDAYDFKDANGKTLREQFEGFFTEIKEKFAQQQQTWLSKLGKKLEEVISKKGENAKVAEEYRTSPSKLAEAIGARAAEQAMTASPKNGLPSEIDIDEAVSMYVSIYETKGMDPADVKALQDMYRAYFTELNKLIQETKEKIKLSKLTADERKIWEEYKGLSEAQIAEKVKGLSPDKQQQVLAIQQKLKEMETEAEGAAQELKEGGFIATVTGLIEALIKIIEKILGKLGIKTGEEKEAAEATEIVTRNPLGDGTGKMRVTSWPGKRTLPKLKNGSFGSEYHNGLDIGANEGVEIHAGVQGKIAAKDTDKDAGNYVKIELPDGRKIVYAHMKEPSPLTVGQEVTPDTVVGAVGQTGDATGPHLHLAVEDSASHKINPIPFFEKYTVKDASLADAKPNEEYDKYFEGQKAVATGTAQAAAQAPAPAAKPAAPEAKTG